MNMSNAILRERPTRKQKISASSIKVKAAHPPNLRLRRALWVVSIVVFFGLLCSAAFGANPAEEMAKAGATGGIDPKGNSWVSIEKSIEQFAHPSFILRLFLSLT